MVTVCQAKSSGFKLINQVCISKSIPSDILQDKAVILNDHHDLVPVYWVFTHIGVLGYILNAALRTVVYNFQVAEPLMDPQVLWVSWPRPDWAR